MSTNDETLPGDDAWSTGSCHCGRVKFAARGKPTKVVLCNCSICTRKGYLHWIVPRAEFRIGCSEADLTLYQFGTKVAKHWFCPVCGCSPFYVPRSDPDKIDINARCLDGVDLGALAIEGFDGQNWEQHYERVYAPQRDA
jgi:hypothetical protein